MLGRKKRNFNEKKKRKDGKEYVSYSQVTTMVKCVRSNKNALHKFWTTAYVLMPVLLHFNPVRKKH